MPRTKITPGKLRRIITLHDEGRLSNNRIANLVGISRSTLQDYLGRYRRCRQNHPETLDLDYSTLLEKRRTSDRRNSPRYAALVDSFCWIAKQKGSGGRHLKALWAQYRQGQPDGYSYSAYASHYKAWSGDKGNSKRPSHIRAIHHIPEGDMKVLRAWRRCNDRRKWERAVVIIEAHTGCCVQRLCSKVERARRLVQRWITGYAKSGLDGLQMKRTRGISAKTASFIEEKKKRIVEILHQSPRLFGVNRATWSLATLAETYQAEHGEFISTSMVSAYLRSMRFRMRNAKKVLTSPDPDYRSKLQQITQILAHLGPQEKFFSIDEYGPFAVKRQGGKAWIEEGTVWTVPQRQKSKGSLIVTAALELSTNQITHFYSEKKNTDEMIKLLTVLLGQYRDQDRIFFSWDAASWHASKKFYQEVERVNEVKYRRENRTPLVMLAPLPSSAQFLNVIESVFSGMAKSIIHNSDYESNEECRRAVDQYFAARNQYFRDNPKRAGRKIWGKELVAPEFRPHNNCKDPNWR